MAELLERSARIIDEGEVADVNPMDGRLYELGDGLAMVAAFSHVVAFATEAGLTLFDVSLAAFGPTAVAALRGWRDQRVDTVVYTHGHGDHVGGMAAFQAAADEAGEARPRIVSHAGVPERFRRYERTHGYNDAINRRQFGGSGLLGDAGSGGSLFPRRWVQPDVTYTDRLQLRVGDLDVELRHGRGETDDHTWAWVPSRRAVVAGDFFIWMFPNAGNPQKVQRYPGEWAQVLREMAALEPELLLPAHGLPIEGRQRVVTALDDTARALEIVVGQALTLMNEGAPLDAIVHTVRVPDDLLDRPYLRPFYDEPEFVVRNVWRLYGGWYDGNPARLKPAPDAAVAAEVAVLAGGADALARRALAVADGGDLRLACQLAEWAVGAVGAAGARGPLALAAHEAAAEIYRRRREVERSLMAQGIFRSAEARSLAALDEG